MVLSEVLWGGRGPRKGGCIYEAPRRYTPPPPPEAPQQAPRKGGKAIKMSPQGHQRLSSGLPETHYGPQHVHQRHPRIDPLGFTEAGWASKALKVALLGADVGTRSAHVSFSGPSWGALGGALGSGNRFSFVFYCIPELPDPGSGVGQSIFCCILQHLGVTRRW